MIAPQARRVGVYRGQGAIGTRAGAAAISGSQESSKRIRDLVGVVNVGGRTGRKEPILWKLAVKAPVPNAAARLGLRLSAGIFPVILGGPFVHERRHEWAGRCACR